MEKQASRDDGRPEVKEYRAMGKEDGWALGQVIVTKRQQSFSV